MDIYVNKENLLNEKSEVSAQIQQIEISIPEKENLLKDLHASIDNHNNNIGLFTAKIQEAVDKRNAYHAKVAEFDSQLQILQQNITSKNDELNGLSLFAIKRKKEAKLELEALHSQLSETEKHKREYQSSYTNIDTSGYSSALTQEKEGLEKDEADVIKEEKALASMQNQIEKAREKLTDLGKQIVEAESQIKAAEEAIAKEKAAIKAEVNAEEKLRSLIEAKIKPKV